MRSPQSPAISTPAALIIILLAGAATLGRVAAFDFTTWDDQDTVARNPKLNPPTARSIHSFWTEPHMDLYIPVTYTVWALVANSARQPDGTLDPRAFHLLNLALHLTAAAIVYLLLRELLRNEIGALFGALLFAVHPFQVESVAWVSGMKDVLFGLLSLAAIWQYVRLARDQSEQALLPTGEWWARYLIATALFALALLSKPTAVVVPAVLVALDWCIIGRPLRRALSWLWPWFVIAMAVAFVARLAQPAHHSATVALWVRPVVAIDALAFYLAKLVLPIKMTFDYGRTPNRVLETGRFWWTWLVPALAGVMVVLLRRRARPVAVGAIVAMLVLLPVLGLVPFDFQAYSTVGDHYMYLAMLGPAIALGWLVARSNRLVAVAAVVMLLLLAARSFDQARYWQNSTTLFQRAISVNPSSYAAYNSLAAIAIDEGRADDAIALTRRALLFNPRYAAAHNTRAEALRRTGDIQGAIASYRDSLKYEQYPPALSNLAAMLAEQGNFAEAIPLAKQALEIDPHVVSSRMNLAKMYLGANDPTAAKRELQLVLQLDPDNQEARQFLAELP